MLLAGCPYITPRPLLLFYPLHYFLLFLPLSIHPLILTPPSPLGDQWGEDKSAVQTIVDWCDPAHNVFYNVSPSPCCTSPLKMGPLCVSSDMFHSKAL